MKTKFWQTHQFKALEKEWYEKLKEQNFDDVEEKINGKDKLKQWASNCYRSQHQIARESKLVYFELLGQFLHKETDFKDEVERFIMLRKSEGAPIKLISEELEAQGERCHRDTVRLIIQKYEAKWRIKRK